MSAVIRRMGPLAPTLLLLALSGSAASQPMGSQEAAEPTPQAPSPPPPAAVSAPPKKAEPPWWKGRIYSWASVGTTFAYDQTYGSANVGVGWLMRNGIAPNVEVGYAFGNSPTLWSLRPGVSWYLPIPVVQPYIGAFYTHWFVGSGLPDENGIGGRAGFSLGRVLALGGTYDHAHGGDRNSDSWTPTLSAGYSF